MLPNKVIINSKMLKIVESCTNQDHIESVLHWIRDLYNKGILNIHDYSEILAALYIRRRSLDEICELYKKGELK